MRNWLKIVGFCFLWGAVTFAIFFDGVAFGLYPAATGRHFIDMPDNFLNLSMAFFFLLACFCFLLPPAIKKAWLKTSELERKVAKTVSWVIGMFLVLAVNLAWERTQVAACVITVWIWLSGAIWIWEIWSNQQRGGEIRSFCRPYRD
jgi:hypothetical protein